MKNLINILTSLLVWLSLISCAFAQSNNSIPYEEIEGRLKEVATAYIIENIPEHKDDVHGNFVVIDYKESWHVGFSKVTVSDGFIRPTGGLPILEISKETFEVLCVGLGQ